MRDSKATRAERLAAVVEGAMRWQITKEEADTVSAELRRLAESEAKLLEALELAAEYVEDYCAERKKALGHVPPCDERAVRVLGELIAKTKEARK